MEVLIQNNSDSPAMVPIKGTNGEVERTLFLGERQVTKVSQEIYEKFILTCGFFKSRIEDGTLRILNADMLGANAIEQSRQLGELAYQKYVDMMKKIRSAGGLANKQFQPYLNADGTPKLDLLHANFGRNIDPEVAEQFRTRYLAEAGEGMHEDVLKLPGGVKVDTGVRDVDVQVEEQLEESQTNNSDEAVETEKTVAIAKQIAQIRQMKLADLKSTADAMAVEYDGAVTEKTLRKAIIDFIKNKG